MIAALWAAALSFPPLFLGLLLEWHTWSTVCSPDVYANHNHNPYEQYCSGGARMIATFIDTLLIKMRDNVLEIIVMLSTVAMAGFTGTIWSISKRQLTHSRQVDRAYISGGGNRASDNIGTADYFLFRVNNYGQTPGRLFRIGYGSCNIDEFSNLPQTPRYRFINTIDSWIGPGTPGLPIARGDLSPEADHPIFYGRFYYETIFGEKYSSGFFYLLPEALPGDSQSIIPPSDAYVEDREEPNE